MDDLITTAEIVSGAVAVLLYVGLRRSTGELGQAVVLFVSGVGLAAGLNVCALALGITHIFTEHGEVCRFGDGKQYLFLGGFAVIWVSVGAARAAFSNQSAGAGALARSLGSAAQPTQASAP
jgi:hypothetical protein